MKKIYLLGAACALAAAVSCNNETELPETVLDYANGQSAEITAPPQGGEVKLGFKSSGTWDVTTVTNWLDFDKVSGKAGDNSLTVTVDENSDLEGDRSGEIVIHSDNKELVFTITQVLSDKIAALGETSVELDANGGTAELKFSATKAWSATSTGSWLTLSKTSGEASYDNAISITAPVNIEADRTAQVKIVCGTAELTYTVQQKFINGISVIGSDKVNLPELGGEAEIKFSAVSDWTASTDASWLTLSASSGKASSEVAVKLSAGVNVDADRTASVKVSGGNKEVVFTVSQKMATSTLAYTTDSEDAGQVLVYATNGSAKLDFIAVEAWSAATEADWITITETAGEPGTFSIGVTAADNVSLAYRSDVVTITSASGKSTLDFIVFQNSPFGDYCGYWTASGILASNSGTGPHSETWIFADSQDNPGNGGMKGLIGESDNWGTFMWEPQLEGAKIETGPDHIVNLYNFGEIGVAAIAPVYRCSFETAEGPKGVIFYTYTRDNGSIADNPVYCLLSEDKQSMQLVAFTYDQYPNPTKLVPTSDFDLTYALFKPIADAEGNLAGVGEYMGYTFGGTFKVESVTRGAAATAAINAVLDKISAKPGRNAKLNGKNIPSANADLVKCERAVFLK